MELEIDDSSNYEFIMIDDIYKIFIIHDVVKYKMRDESVHIVNITNNPSINEKQHYFIIDTNLSEPIWSLGI